jgi:5-methylcytosine-specific restriction protein A
MRRRISTRERVDIFKRCEARCHICQGRINTGDPWDVEHIIPLALGGDDYGDNLAPAHRRCHEEKTKQDATNTARAKRREAKHLGARKSARPLPGSRASGIRKRMSGKVERW